MGIIILVLLGYLLGSMPTGYIFGKILKGIDIRDHGSGNVGATNVFRTLGKGPGFIVFIIDFMKGLIAVSVFPSVLANVFPGLRSAGAIVLILAGISAIAGHIWTVFLDFKGGKGVATTAGVLAALAPFLLFSSLAVFGLVFYVWKYVSLASISAAVMLPIFAVIFNKDLGFVIFCSVLSIVAVVKHKSNIRRLIRGEEKKLI